MKTIITASALMLVSNIAMASSWEDNWGGPDLSTGVYGNPTTQSDPKPSMGSQSVSLDTFSRGNSDHVAHDRVIENSPIDSGEGYATSLDEFGAGNPDHV